MPRRTQHFTLYQQGQVVRVRDRHSFMDELIGLATSTVVWKGVTFPRLDQAKCAPRPPLTAPKSPQWGAVGSVDAPNRPLLATIAGSLALASKSSHPNKPPSKLSAINRFFSALSDLLLDSQVSSRLRRALLS